MKKTIFLLIVLLSNVTCFAGLYRAGEITYKHISGLTYEIKVTTYTDIVDTNGVPQIIIEFGDGTIDTIFRTGTTFIPSYESVKNTYLCQHTYSGQGTYIISFADTFRTAGVNNIPDSGNKGICIKSLININPFLGINNSPDFLTIPLDQAFSFYPFTYNPIAVESDGDSLSYKLMICRDENCADIAGYSYPPTSNIFSLDAITGDLLWDSPIALGDYNFAMLIEEWRLGIEIGYVQRDIQIHVKGGNGIENYFNNDRINIFPNPTHDKLHINSKTEKWSSVEIIDFTGRSVLLNNSFNEQTIDISGLPRGVYLLRLSTEKKMFTEKFVKE